MSEIDNNELPVGTIEDILSCDDTQEDWVNVPEWKCKVKVKALSKGEQLKVRKVATVKGNIDMSRMDGLLFVAGVVEPRFTADHIDRLQKKSAVAFDRVLNRIMELSGAAESEEDVEAQFSE